MRNQDPWIWLPEQSFPDHQTTRYSWRVPESPEHRFAVATFSRDYRFEKPIRRLALRFSGDTAFALFCGGKLLANGPVLPGGDFLEEYNETRLPWHYASCLELTGGDCPGLEDGILRLYAQVRLSPSRCFDYSMGHGGFFLTATVTFADGTTQTVTTDSSWSAQLLSAYMAPGEFDNSREENPALPAQPIADIWNCMDAPIPCCTLTPLALPDSRITLAPGEKLIRSFPLEGILAGYPTAELEEDGFVRIRMRFRELEEEGTAETLTFAKKGSYLGLQLHSAGEILVECENLGSGEAALRLGFIASCYPVTCCAQTQTSDEELNQVLKTCLHTLKYCRQSIHLDSPRHCEPLACTGDYYIETLMTAFSYGDMRLAAFDVQRTALLLENRDGRLFHTTYSLIWVQMLMDVYRFNANTDLLFSCLPALQKLLDRFHRYLGENGLVETPPDYMFIDWLAPDGISMHHPPKALGQTCLNLYYYGALKTAAEIYATVGQSGKREECIRRQKKLAAAIEQHLYDHERGLFFEGLNTPTPEHLIREYMPRNVAKRYYRSHANILAAYFGFFSKERCAALLEQILEDPRFEPVQPYFCHFLLEAVYRCGLRERYTGKILEQWKAPVKECPKGLVEGFIKPEPGYSFDHSHAWGGTPAWSLPLALTGLEILEPGYKRIRLSPSLLGLAHASVQIPTPFGMICVAQQQGSQPQISLPEGIILE